MIFIISSLSIESSSSSTKTNWLWESWIIRVEVVWEILSVSWFQIMNFLWWKDDFLLVITPCSELDCGCCTQEKG
jgi:hypothetical protein